MTDKPDKIERIQLEETGKLLDQANEAVAVHELRRALQRQAERDLVIEEIRGIIDTLSVGHVMAIEHIKRLEHGYSVLLRQQQELHERQDIISAVCDAFAEKLDREAKAREALAADVADRD